MLKKSQKGSSLLEALIAIAILSFGVLGNMAFQANMLAQSTQVSYRLDASMLVSSLIGAADADSVNYRCYVFPQPTTVQSNCVAARNYVEEWAAKVALMPGAASSPPVASIDGNDNLTVTVFWKLPNEPEARPPHAYSATSRPIGG